MTRVKDGGALPAPFLILTQFSELSHDTLTGAALGALRFDEREVAVLFAVLGSLVLAKKHPCLHLQCGTALGSGKQVGPHYNAIRKSNYAWRYRNRRFTCRNR